MTSPPDALLCIKLRGSNVPTVGVYRLGRGGSRRWQSVIELSHTRSPTLHPEPEPELGNYSAFDKA